MDYLGALRMFVQAVEVGSFSKAAIATNTKTSTVSRAMASLEEDLGVSLFHRAARISPSRAPHSTSTHAAFCGAWRKRGMLPRQCRDDHTD
jgi:DNA-binding transcriptional LysR family regulator